MELDIASSTAVLQLIVGEPNEPSQIDLKGKKVQIGRATSNDVQLKSVHVSRKHAVFVYEQSTNTWFINDLSTNGVRINDQKIPKGTFVPLTNLDGIELIPTGTLQYKFLFSNDMPSSNQARDQSRGELESGRLLDAINKKTERQHLSDAEVDVVNHSDDDESEHIDIDFGLLDVSSSSCKVSKQSYHSKSVSKRRHAIEDDACSGSEWRKRMRFKSGSTDSGDDFEIGIVSPSLFPVEEELEISKSHRKSLHKKSKMESRKGKCKHFDRDQIILWRQRVKEYMDKAEKLEKENEILTAEKLSITSEMNGVKNEAMLTKDTILNKVMENLDQEFSCSICTEFFINATVINCGHTFCEHCINEWLKVNTGCAICRTHVTSKSKHHVVNNFITKILEQMSPEVQVKRKNDLKERNKDIKIAAVKAQAEAHTFANNRRIAQAQAAAIVHAQNVSQQGFAQTAGQPQTAGTPSVGNYRSAALIPEENFVSFLLSRHFFSQMAEPRPRALVVSRAAVNRAPTSTIETPPIPPRRQSARIMNLTRNRGASGVDIIPESESSSDSE